MIFKIFVLVLPVYYHNSEILKHNLPEKLLLNKTNTIDNDTNSFINKSNENTHKNFGSFLSSYYDSMNELIKFWSAIDFKYKIYNLIYKL